MKSFRGTGYAFSIGTAALLLAGCGFAGTQRRPGSIATDIGGA